MRKAWNTCDQCEQKPTSLHLMIYTNEVHRILNCYLLVKKKSSVIETAVP